MSKKFTKVTENFKCDNCGNEVQGNGYTNHCPMCLWSKHVDINPGDRSSNCKGMMEPIEITSKGDKFIILHKCKKCFHQKLNKVSKKDDFAEIIKISQKVD